MRGEPKRFADVKTAKIALDRLEEHSIIVREKPFGSKVILTKKSDSIDIIVPDRRYPIHWGLAFALSFFILPIPLTMLSIFFISSSFEYYVFFSILTRCLSFAPIVYNFIYYFFGQIHININKGRISSYRELEKLRFKQAPISPTANIDRLQCREVIPQKGKNKIPATKEIIIAAGAREYRFYSNSEAESEWLLSELSEWLNLPIIR